MRSIINSTYITLDGVIQNPQDWPSLGSSATSRRPDPDRAAAPCDAVLMGRHTYDGFAPVWSGRSGDPYTDQINAMHEVRRLDDADGPEWANTPSSTTTRSARSRGSSSSRGEDIVQYGFGRSPAR